MKHLRKVALLLCALMLLTTLVACSGGDEGTANNGGDTNTEDNSGENTGGPTPDNPVTLKFSGINGDEHITTIKMKEIAAEIEELTEGAVKVDVYAANSLGEMNLVLQSMIDGSVEMSMGYVDATFAKTTDLFTVGYLISNFEENKIAMANTSNMFKALYNDFDNLGLELVGLFGEGLTGMSTTKVPDNYNVAGAAKNTVMRVPLSETIKNCVTTMGFQTVSITFADTYSSIQTGVCDGSSCQTPTGVYTQLVVVIDYYNPYQQVPEVLEALLSPVVYELCTEEQVQIIKDTLIKYCDEMADNAEANCDEGMANLEAAGVEILPLTDEEIAAFAELERSTNWGVLPEMFGEDVMNGIYADLGIDPNNL